MRGPIRTGEIMGDGGASSAADDTAAASHAHARATSWWPGTADPWPVPCSRRVLLVQPDTGGCGRSLLEDAGYEVRPIELGAVTAPLLRDWAPDLIVLDACGDRAGAIELAHRLNADTTTTDIPVLAIVPCDEAVELPSPLASGADDILTSPVRPWELLIRVRSLVRLREHRQELLDSRGLHGEQTRMWGVLLDFSRSVATIAGLDDLLDRIVRAAAEMTSSRRVSLMLPDAEQEYLRIARSIGLDDAFTQDVRVPIGEAVAGTAFRTGRPVSSLDDREAKPRRDGYDFDAFVSMPMIYTTMSMVHQRVGVLNIANRYGDRPFEEWELEYIDLLGSIAGSAIDDIHSRTTREAMLRMERDLQLARQIQRSTFPRELPVLDGFEIAAWSEPAEETAGDTYDVIGCRNGSPDGHLTLSTTDADRAYLLLADATGHGIGPALSVTQVRAMLRMAVRMKPELDRIARHLNDQLCADLPDGRFVTAWLGEVNARDHTLTGFSAGQAPIIRYAAADDRWHVLPADTMPLGITNGLEIAINAPIVMAPGDLVAVISDGIIDAANGVGEQFGTDRVLAVLAGHRREGPRHIQIALREAVAEFTRGTPAADDRTAILLKRT